MLQNLSFYLQKIKLKMLEYLRDRIKKLEPFYEGNVLKNIFSWKELEYLLNLRPFNSQSRFKVFLKEEYKWPCQAWVTDINCFPPSIIKDIIKKYPCHLADSSRVNEKINSICEELETITKLPTDSHIYFDLREFHDFGGFGVHFDFAHNLIVQVEGISNIKIWNVKGFEENKRIITHLDEKPILDVIMKPGDVCYIPAYHYHKVVSLSKRLSVSFPSSVSIDFPFQEREWIKIT